MRRDARSAARAHELDEAGLPVESWTGHDQQQQRVVQLLGIPRRRRGLFAHACDRFGIEPPEIARRFGQAARNTTARVRRSSSGASSRNVNGLPFRISCAERRGLGRVA